MYKSFKDVKTIQFPVYYLNCEDYYRQDGLLMSDGLIIDDTNMSEKTLGIRRLQSSRNKKDMHKLRKAYPDFMSMIRSNKNRFIDNNGIPFKYRKTVRAPLKYHLVTKIERKEDYTIIFCRGIPFPFNIPRPPYGDARWARILYYQEHPWTLYDFSEMKGKDSFRRV